MSLPKWFKPAAWGAIAGAVTLVIVATTSGMVITNDAAEQVAKNRSEKAVLAALTPICVAQFKNGTDQAMGSDEREKAGSAQARGLLLAALKKEDEWKRGDFVGKKGWATMPGSKQPNSAVARACATELMKLTKASN